MKKLKWYLIFLYSCISVVVLGQEIPPVYSQFYMNPVVYNPAFAGSDGYASLYMVHRRQWIGIEGAPSTSLLSLHSPLSKTAAGGVLISHDKAGILQTATAEGQFAYIIPIAKEHNFRLGLSTGVSKLSLDLSEATPEQKTYLANRNANEINFQAKFGVNYHYKRLNIGFSSNSLFKNTITRAPGDKLSLSPLQDIVINAIYYMPLGSEQVHLEPYLIYHQLGSFNRTEAGALFYFMNACWVGGSYRTDYGITGLFGLNFKEAFKIGYAYEMGSLTIGGFSNPSHEIQLVVKLGKEKNYTKEVTRKPRFEF